MRLFLAIDLPFEIKTKIDTQLQSLEKDYRQFNWVPPENFHITTHFIGEVNNPDEIKKKIGDAIYDCSSFHLYSLGANLFINRKIMMYISFRREKNLEILVERVEESLFSINNKKFVPHLTIARYKIPSKQQYLLLKKKLLNLEIDFDFHVEKLNLFESVQDGPRRLYKTIAQFDLLQ